MADLERLIADHAYWADEWKRLKQLGSEELRKCNGSKRTKHTESDKSFSWYSGLTCFDVAIGIFKDQGSRYYCYDGYSFDEIWIGCFEDFEPCEHCKKVRELKKERGKAGRKLGQIRGTLTKIGRRLNAE